MPLAHSGPCRHLLQSKHEVGPVTRLGHADKLQLLRIVCAAASADLEVTPSEKTFVLSLALKLGVSGDEAAQFERWLETPPAPEEVDPASVPPEHRRSSSRPSRRPWKPIMWWTVPSTTPCDCCASSSTRPSSGPCYCSTADVANLAAANMLHRKDPHRGVGAGHRPPGGHGHDPGGPRERHARRHRRGAWRAWAPTSSSSHPTRRSSWARPTRSFP